LERGALDTTYHPRQECPTMILTARLQGTPDPRAVSLRNVCFPGPEITPDATDAFDSCRAHLVVSRPEAVVGYARLTMGPRGPFESWTTIAPKFPTGADVVDIGRICVADQNCPNH
jgi:hypothetical protein